MWWSGCKLNLPIDVYDSGKTLCHLSLSLALDTSYHLVFQNITSVITLCQMAHAGHSTSGVESGKWMEGRNIGLVVAETKISTHENWRCTDCLLLSNWLGPMIGGLPTDIFNSVLM